tara:strand:+ start:11349 stop:11864 length:516 start_codon:yes stop_codon:yes gene_type:complete
MNASTSETMKMIEDMPLSKSLFTFLDSHQEPFFVGSWLRTLTDKTLLDICSIDREDPTAFNPNNAQDVMLTALHAYNEEIQASEDEYFDNELIVELTKSLILAATIEYLIREGVVASDTSITINPFANDEIAFIQDAYIEKRASLASLPTFNACIKPVIEADGGAFARSIH